MSPKPIYVHPLDTALPQPNCSTPQSPNHPIVSVHWLAAMARARARWHRGVAAFLAVGSVLLAVQDDLQPAG